MKTSKGEKTEGESSENTNERRHTTNVQPNSKRREKIFSLFFSSLFSLNGGGSLSLKLAAKIA
jgi:hypothetical protein